MTSPPTVRSNVSGRAGPPVRSGSDYALIVPERGAGPAAAAAAEPDGFTRQ
jgi:hypothetical protein